MFWCDMFWSQIGSGFWEPGGTPPPMILRSTITPPSPPPVLLTSFYLFVYFFSVRCLCIWHSNKHNTTWKMLCTVFPRSLFLYQKSHSFGWSTSTTRTEIPYARTFHEVFYMYNLCSRRMEVVWGARDGHRRGEGELTSPQRRFSSVP